MDLAYHLLVVLHLLGMASIVGSYLVALRQPRFLPGMLHGALTQVITGLIMVGMLEAGAVEPEAGGINHPKIGVKLLVALVVLVLAWVNRRRTQSLVRGVFHAIGGLAVLNVLVAVLWT
jgi:hypothetical protein